MNQIKVKLLRISGSDADVVKYARVSSGHTNEIDQERFIKWLAKKGHDTPQEYISTAWEIEAPQRISTQIVRHRLATHSVASARYGHKFTEVFSPETLYALTDWDKEACQLGCLAGPCLDAYNALVDKYKGHPDEKRVRELAAMYLPQGILTKQVLSINFRSLRNFLNLRDNRDAQIEIQYIAKEMKRLLLQEPQVIYSVRHFLGVTQHGH